MAAIKPHDSETTSNDKHPPGMIAALSRILAKKKSQFATAFHSIKNKDRFRHERSGKKCGNRNWSRFPRAFRKKKRQVQQASRRANR